MSEVPLHSCILARPVDSGAVGGGEWSPVVQHFIVPRQRDRNVFIAQILKSPIDTHRATAFPSVVAAAAAPVTADSHRAGVAAAARHRQNVEKLQRLAATYDSGAAVAVDGARLVVAAVDGGVVAVAVVAHSRHRTIQHGAAAGMLTLL